MCNGNFIQCSSSDFYNSCATGWWNSPNGAAGYQQPRTGNGYAGIGVVFGYPDSVGGRECIEVKLIEPLKAGIAYCVEFYVSLAEASSLATDAIHLGFSDSIVYQNGYMPIPLFPAITCQGNIIADTLNWVRISGSYVAYGGEQYIVISDFYNNYDSNFDSIRSPAEDFCYYFIDDVSVSVCQSDITAPNVFTPNADGVNDFFVLKFEWMQSYSCRIFNRWGNEVAVITNNDEGWSGKNKTGNDCPDGVYYYLLSGKGNDEKEYEFKGFVQLLR